MDEPPVRPLTDIDRRKQISVCGVATLEGVKDIKLVSLFNIKLSSWQRLLLHFVRLRKLIALIQTLNQTLSLTLILTQTQNLTQTLTIIQIIRKSK